jgi:hypothetical protein
MAEQVTCPGDEGGEAVASSGIRRYCCTDLGAEE